MHESKLTRGGPCQEATVALHPLLPNGTLFHDVPVPSGSQRKRWLNDAMSKVRGSAVVFCDPDNGLSFQGECDSRRHISSEEVRNLYRSGHSVVVYHTPDRSGPHRAQIEFSLDHFRREIAELGPSWAAHFRRGSSRVFFVLAQESHAFLMDRAIRQFRSSGWTRDRHFEIIRRDSEPERPSDGQTDRQDGSDVKGSGSLPPSPIRQVQARAEKARPERDTAGETEHSVRVVLNDNGGLNVAANPWLKDVSVPCRLCAPGVLTLSIEAAFSGRSDMYRISPSALSLARRFGFAGDHLSRSKLIAFEATICVKVCKQ